MNRPQTHEYPAWAETYIKLIDGDDVINLLERQATEYPDFIRNLIEKADYAYAPGKWTIKEMTGHIIDTERILVYRLTCFARNERQPLPGFEEDEYVANAHFSDRSLLSLSEEFSLLRKSDLYLFKSLTEAELEKMGTASNRQITVRALLFVIAGHIMHHVQIIKERYL
ncbi:DinB family protein [Pedobacter psychroterrae]|uniref:DinB family protein n=1 Tax=Pedobacter psychroterrae TaxID=2530453 RepID=A0A4V2MLR2_9SPHI|nr:DinB family protein [Pedobacter psychroterrae]TCD03017.1 DinB family protein [Pedobacter psychroterrae]